MAVGGSTIIAIPDWSEGATFAASNTQSGFNVDWLDRLMPGDRWQTNTLSAGSVTITVTRAAAALVNFGGLYFTNASPTASVRLEFDLAASNVYDSSPFGAGQVWPSGDQTGFCNNAAFDLTSAFCWEAVVRIDTSRLQGIVTFIDTGESNLWTLTVRQSSTGTIEVMQNNCGSKVLESTTIPVDGEEFHLALAYGSSTLRLVVNGVTEDSVGSFTIPGTGGNLGPFCGMPSLEAPAGTQSLIGMLNDVRWWNTDRTDGQIEANRHAPLSPAYPAALKLYFKLLEEFGGTTADEIVAATWNFGTDPDKYWAFSSLIHSRPGLTGWPDYSWSKYIGDSVSADEMRLSILDAQNPAGVFGAGRLYAGDAWKVSNASAGKQFGWSVGVLGKSSRTDLAGGQLSVQRRTASPRRTARFSLIGTDEEAMFDRVFRLLMSREGLDVVVAFDLDESPRLAQEKTVYGLLQERHSFVTNFRSSATPNDGVFVHEFTVEGLT